MKPQLVRKYRRSHRWNIGLMFRKNPTLLLGVSLPFAVATATGLRPALVMAVEMLVIGVCTAVATCLTARRLPYWVRAAVNVAVATIAMMGVRSLIRTYVPDVYSYLGTYIYLMALYGMVFLEGGKRPAPRGRGASLKLLLADTLLQTGVFAFLMLCTALFREYLGSGMLFALTVPVPFKLPALLLPFFGFICVGFLLAEVRFLSKRLLRFGAAEYVRRADRDSARYTRIHVEDAGDRGGGDQ